MIFFFVKNIHVFPIQQHLKDLRIVLEIQERLVMLLNASANSIKYIQNCNCQTWPSFLIGFDFLLSQDISPDEIITKKY